MDEAADQTVDASSTADGEAVDQELEKVLVSIERGLDWFVRSFQKAGTWVKTIFNRKNS
jgi:hypothetical protein